MSKTVQWRTLALFALLAMIPAACLAAEEGAVLRANGRVLIDGNPALPSSAIFLHSLIATEKNSYALIDATGSSIEIGEETIVEFDGNELRLEHGSLSVLTFTGLVVKVGCITAVPVTSEQTHYQVNDRSDRVTVSAVKNDVNIESTSRNPKVTANSARSQKATVHQGEEKSRDDKCAAQIETHGVAAGIGGLFNSPYAQGIAAGAVIGTTCWVLCGTGTPASPAVP